MCFSFRSAAAAVLVRAAVKNFSRNPTAERQQPQGASQIESGNKKLHALLCAARAASALQRRAMAGQGRSPCGLGESKGGHSSAKNGPLSLCAALRRGHGECPDKMRPGLHGGGHQSPAVRPTYKAVRREMPLCRAGTAPPRMPLRCNKNTGMLQVSYKSAKAVDGRKSRV